MSEDWHGGSSSGAGYYVEDPADAGNYDRNTAGAGYYQDANENYHDYTWPNEEDDNTVVGSHSSDRGGAYDASISASSNHYAHSQADTTYDPETTGPSTHTASHQYHDLQSQNYPQGGTPQRSRRIHTGRGGSGNTAPNPSSSSQSYNQNQGPSLVERSPMDDIADRFKGSVREGGERAAEHAKDAAKRVRKALRNKDRHGHGRH